MGGKGGGDESRRKGGWREGGRVEEMKGGWREGNGLGTV
jgi:hypothetical protein